MGCGASTAKKPPTTAGEQPEAERKIPMTPERHKMLKDAFHAMDFDKDGFIVVDEFVSRAKTLAPEDPARLESMFYFFDDRGAQHRKHRNDNKLSQDEWISGIRAVGVERNLSDDDFDKELKAIIAHCASLNTQS